MFVKLNPLMEIEDMALARIALANLMVAGELLTLIDVGGTELESFPLVMEAIQMLMFESKQGDVLDVIVT